MDNLTKEQKAKIHLILISTINHNQSKNVNDIVKDMIEVSECQNYSFHKLMEDFVLYGIKYMQIKYKEEIEK
jgi:hypothetical protein